MTGVRLTNFTLKGLQGGDSSRVGIRKKMFRAAMSIPSLKYILSCEKRMPLPCINFTKLLTTTGAYDNI